MRYIDKIDLEYEGIVFDLDGTLLDETGEMGQKNINIIKSLTELSIFIIFATGRGPRSTDGIINEYSFYCNGVNYIINFNGSLIRKINKNGKVEILKEHKLYNHAEILDKIINDDFFKEILTTKDMGVDFYTDSDIYGITLVFNEQCFIDGILELSIYERVLKYMNANFPDTLKILYTGKTIDILSKIAGKENAVTFLENYLKNRKGYFARVGDSGNQGGNDHCMLSDNNGFTVNQGDDSIHIFSQDGERQYGQKALSQLIMDIKLTSGITIHASSFEDPSFLEEQVRKYKEIGEKVKNRYQQEVRILNNSIIGNHFVELNDSDFRIDKVFSFNGAVRFGEGEVQELEFKEIKKYLIKYGNEYYGRGNIFYFFESFIKKHEDYEITDINNLNQVLSYFLSVFHIVIEDYQKLLSYLDGKNRINILEYKTSLIILDTMKSYILKLLNILSYGKIIGINITNQDLDIVKGIVKSSVSEYYNLFEMNSFDRTIEIDLLKDILNKCKGAILTGENNSRIDFRAYNRIMRGAPEACHPLANYIYGKTSSNGLQNKIILSDPIILIGCHYGGIELPYILGYFLTKKGYLIEKYIGTHVSKYENANIDKKVKNLYDIDDFEMQLFDKTIIVCDDGIFSGSTLSDIGIFLAKRGPKNIFYSVGSFVCDRMIEKYKKVGGPTEAFLDQLYENGLTRVLQVYKSPDTQPGLLFNMKEQRVMNILSKGKDVVS